MAAIALAALWVQAARLPYNAQGRYFAEGVVHHAQAVPVYGLMALACLVAALWLAWRARRRPRA